MATLILLAAPCAARAQGIQGEWTNTPASCGKYSTNNDNLRIRADGYGMYEGFCAFSRGSKESPDHWLMRSTCSVEGGGQEAEIPVEMTVIGGKLRMVEGDKTFYYGTKCTGPSTASPSPRTYWDHNGSVMYLIADGKRRRFFYSQPRGGMVDAGAQTDALLFDGMSDGSSYVGTAFIFSAHCGQYPYRVAGPILDDGRRVQLRGYAPRVNDSCAVSGHREDIMSFELEPGQ